MIQYFYYERHYIDDKWFVKNEKILDEKPKTTFDGYEFIISNNIYTYMIDVELYTKYSLSLNIHQEAYDRLLIQERNKKLETVL